MDRLLTAWRAARALVFDFDGVLADGEPVYRRTYNEALLPYGHQIGEAEYYEHWSSKGEGLAGQVRRHGLTGIDADQVAEEQRWRYRALALAGAVPLLPGARELLERLGDPAEPAARPHVIASNTDADVVLAVLRAGGARLPAVVGGRALPPKPAPDIYLAALDALGASPAETLAFEDSEKGIRAAGAAGIPVVLVRYERNRRLALAADLEVDGVAALLQAVERLRAG